MNISTQQLIYTVQIFLLSATALVVFVLGCAGLVVIGFLLWKYRNREAHSLEYVTLQVAVPRDNEIKIDAAEQMFSSLHSIHHGGFWSFLKPAEHISFEIVARREDIRFYVSMPHHLMDLVEKQIHGAYPGADIKEVEDYTIFSETGEVAFASLIPKGADYMPIRVYRDLPVDPLSSITSVLAKMQQHEGAAIQILVQPAGGKWRKQGHSFISNTKKNEANPEKANFSVDHKTLEVVEQKVSKPGFKTVIRVVVSSGDKEQAKMHLHNIEASFHQYSSDHNHFGKARLLLKGLFVKDFIYRYFPIVNLPFFKQTGILNSDELATVFHFPNKSIETAHIYWLNAKRAPAPSQIPDSGLFLGKSRYRGVERKIYLGDCSGRIVAKEHAI